MDDFVVNNADVKGYTKTEIIFRRNQMPDKFHLVLDGKVDMIDVKAPGTPVIKSCTQGSFVGELEFFAGKPHTYSFVVSEPAYLAEINAMTIDSFISSSPQNVISMLKSVSQRIVEANTVLMDAKVGKCTVQREVERTEIELVNTDDMLIITGSTRYGVRLPDGHEKYLFEKEIDCPVCELKFKTYGIRYSQLETVANRDDFRRKYRDFDDLWYQVWRCPFCDYANFHNDFFKINNIIRKELKMSLPRNSQISKDAHVKSGIDEVLEDYYKLSRILSMTNATSLSKSRMLQGITWIMEDLADKDNEGKLKKILREYLVDTWMNCPVVLSEEDEFKLAMKIGYLYLEENDLKMARTYFLKGSQMKGLNKVYKQKVQDVLISLKS